MFLMDRVLLKFTKLNSAKFISHLDTMRTLHRALRRAGISISYSQGFNPHASISVAAPLSLGIASTAEYADIEIDEAMISETIMEKLNNTLPEGIRIISVVNIDQKMPSSMGSVEGAMYIIKLQHCMYEKEIKSIIQEVLSSSEIYRNKRTKSGYKLIDIRPLIEDIKILNYDREQIEIECLLSTGSKGSLGPEMISELLKEKSKNKIFGYPEMERREIYSILDGKWLNLLAYFSRK
ncbi:MAG: hypothetical protein K0R09_1914 [Clostridiales bacterium]|jgi:radical SAM-linked protein|nr:hypothetical protein [Clostridiales bacterium]